MKRLFPLLFVASALVAGAQTPPPARPAAAIDAAKTDAPISPYVYGQFVEHIGGLVYSTLWSELLEDRKFYYAVGPAPAEPPARPAESGGAPWRRNFGPGRWNPVGPAEAVTMDTARPFVGDHSPRITLAGSEPRGIRQSGVKLERGVAYRGRVQLAGDTTAQVVVELTWGEGAAAQRQTVALGRPTAEFAPQVFSFEATASGPATLAILATGTGSVRIGAVSLMPAETLEGWRPDSVAALKRLRSAVYRFPGGNFVSAHEWRDAIGDPDRRPPVLDPVWHAVQSNDIGTDEFLTLCRLLEVDPYITVNAGTGDAWSAAQYVEYTNGAVDTPMGRLRAAHGHPAPYGVKFWGIGNEMWGDYQYGYMPLPHFLFKHNQFAKAMRRVDPAIVLIACGAMPDTMTGSKQSLKLGRDLVADYFSPADWTGGLLTECFDNFELLSDHFYNFGKTHFSLAVGDQVPNDPHEPITDWMRRPANHIRIKYEQYKEYEKRLPRLVAHPKPLNIDEWAYVGGPYPTYPAYAWVFHEMFRQPALFQMAAHTFATSLLKFDTGRAELTANGLVFQLYRDHFGSLPVAVSGNSPQPKPTEPPGGEQPVVNAGSDTFPLDVVAAWTADRSALTVAVLNPTDVAQPLALGLTGANLAGTGTLWRLAPPAGGTEPVVTSTAVGSLPTELELPPFSISIYVLPAK